MIPSSALWRPLATFWASVLHLPNKIINTFCHSGSLGGEGDVTASMPRCLNASMPRVNPAFTRPRKKAGLSLALSRRRSQLWPLWFCLQLGHPGWLLYDPCTARREGEAVHREHRSPGLGGQGTGTGKWSPSQEAVESRSPRVPRGSIASFW